MPRKIKWTILPFIISSALILAALYIFNLTRATDGSEPLDAIPLSASVIVKINDARRILEKASDSNPIWNELTQLPWFGKIKRQLKFIDSLSHGYPEVRDIINNSPSVFSVHLTGRDKLTVLHVFRLPSRTGAKDIKELISRLVMNSGTMTPRRYEGTEINEVALLDKSGIGNFQFAVHRGILLISFSATILEDALRQMESGESFDADPGFKRIYSTAGKNVVANVFVNFKEFPKSISAFVQNEYKSEIRAVRNFAGWAELDLNPLSEMILMNGFVNPSDSGNTMASVIARQSPGRILADEVLPSSVTAFFALHLSQPEMYFEQYRELLKNEGRFTSYNNTLQSINNSYKTNFPEDFTSVMDREAVLAIDGSNTEGENPGVFFLLRIKSRTQAEERFRSIVTSIAASQSKPVESLITSYRFDADLSFNIYELPIRQLIAKLFGPAYSVLDHHYFVVLDNYIVFADSPGSLKSLIRDYVLNKTLANDATYREFRKDLSPRSNLWMWCDLGRSQSFFSRFLNTRYSKSWQKNLATFQKIRMAGLQLYENNNMLYSNFLLRHVASFSATAQTVWESRLDTLSDFKPVFVANHQTGENEVFVQDLKNNIYLINQVGRVLWKIQLPGPILSEVFQIDYYRNGKLQLLFSTSNQIYLVDRNGNFVERYPVTLRSPATNGVSVFDYDNNRDYRLFIACTDRHVYAYNREGNLLQGWEFNQSESNVTQSVNHFRVGDKDFIVFGDSYKTYILDRKGNPRVNVDAYFPRSANNNYYLSTVSPGGPALVTTDTTGKVYFMSFTGNIRTVELPGKFTNRHYFDFRDVNGDNRPDYIFLEDDRLTVYANDESRLFTYRFGKPVRSKPAYYQFSATDKKLGFVSREANLIYLINSNGELYNGFPLQGNTPFSIGNFGDTLSRFNLVVGSSDNFLYNYRVM